MEIKEHIDASYVEIDEMLNALDTSIIDDASISSLFNEDVYTVNYCCYTPAGHIEVTYGDTEYQDGDYGVWLDTTGKSYLGICEDGKVPYGEYKTYKAGDMVGLHATENVGYYFKEWLKDAQSIDYTSPTIYLQFNDKDINVIGSLNNGVDHMPILDGYTALYGKHLVLTHDTSLINYDAADIKTGDAMDIESFWEDTDPYYNEGDTLTITPLPIEHHVFRYYTIDGGTE